ncbi:chaperone modulator CbpM [Mangrovimonas spongiae]|uniref:MerR family transcriptional regulator n=1 Tax=Mangrovimonas spongiae TaxID=2494697 RepID=A0A3R9MTK6_9FLAO|nr:chaperone modulator CbpM [Mangrovimonas spongiae]RSK40431.1 MerR family transcriptional regulator [Mangrovimonas spongiae]
MDKANLISVKRFCTLHQVPVTFIHELHDYELIEVISTNNNTYLKTTQLYHVEKMIRLHYDLEINFQGIDAIHNLLKQIEVLQDEVQTLKNKLHRFED